MNFTYHKWGGFATRRSGVNLTMSEWYFEEKKNNTVWHSNVRSYHFIWQIYSSQTDPTWITIAYHLDVNIDSSETISYLKCLIIFNPNRAAHLSVGAVGLSTNHVSKFTIQDVEILFRDFSRGRGFDCIFDFGVQLCRDWVQLFRVFWFSDATGTGRIGINGHNGVFGIHGTNLLKCSSTDFFSSSSNNQDDIGDLTVRRVDNFVTKTFHLISSK